MKRGSILTTLIAISLMVSFVSGQRPRHLGGLSTMNFNKAKFDQSLQNAVGPRVMGYQYVLIKNGRVVTENADGLAQTQADGYLKMTTSTPTDIGSLAKFLSGTTMIGLMEKPPTGSTWDSGSSLQQKLNRPFTSIVPNVWKSGNKAGVENITIRQLLQHRSGFDDDKSSNRNVLGFLKDADGFSQAQFNQREYSNINFVLNGYLLPLYAHSTMKDTLNGLVAQQSLDQAKADDYIRRMTGIAMHNLMKQRIWSKMAPKIEPNCDGKSLYRTAAYYYASKDDRARGDLTSLMAKQGHCGGHGGYYLSARDLAEYLAYFSSTDLIVSAAGRDAMYKEGMSTNDRLVWSSSTGNAWLGQKFQMPNVIWSNGIAGGYRNVILRLPQNYYLVLLTNSPDLSVSQLESVGVNAFIAGMQDNF